MGIQEGVIQSIASKENYEEKKEILESVYPLVLLCSLFISIISIIFSKQISTILFQNYEFIDVIIFSGLTLSVTSMNILFLVVLNAFEKLKIYIYLNILISIFSLLLSISLLYFFELRGGLYSIFLSKTVLTTFTFVKIKKLGLLTPIFKFRNINKNVVVGLLSFSIMKLVTIFTNPLTKIYCRTKIQNNISTLDAGIWEGLNQISDVILVFFTVTLSTYYLPLLSKIKRRGELRRLIRTNLFILGSVSLILFVIIFILRKTIIILLFDKNFMLMSELFLYQLIGDYFRILSFVFGYVFWANKLTYHFIFFESFSAILFLVLVEIIFYYSISLVNIPIVYMVRNAIYLIIISIYIHILMKNKFVHT